MRFKYPEKRDINKMYKILKTFYTEDIFSFVEKINQKIFHIKCELFTAVVVVDSKEKRMDIFTGKLGMLTCHNMFAGNAAGIAAHGFDQFHIMQMEKNELYAFDNARYFDKYRFYHKDGNVMCYFSAHPGQVPFVCNDIDTILLIEICEYFLQIKSFYDLGEEKPNESSQEMVGTFEFDDVNMEYDASFEQLEYFDFEPEFKVAPYKDRYFAEKLKDIKIKEGTLHVGVGYSNHPYDTFEYSNDVFQSLNPMYVFACTNEELEYNITSSLYQFRNKNLKSELVKLFNKTGLYDTVVTSNPVIYMMLEKNLKPLGIEVILDYEDFLCFVILMHISFSGDSGISFEEFILLLEKLKENFAEFVEFMNEKNMDMENLFESMASSDDEFDDTIFEEVNEEEFDEEDEMFFISDSKDVC